MDKLPSALDSENCLLASAMLSPSDVLGEMAGTLPAEAFYDIRNGTIWQELTAMHDLGAAVDPVTLTERLMVKGRLEDAGGAHRVAELFTSVPTPSNWRHYLAHVIDRWKRRRLLTVASSLQASAFDLDQEPAAIAADLSKSVAQIECGKVSTRHLRDCLNEAGRILEASHQAGTLTGLDTGFACLNRATGGIKAPDLWVVAGRSGCGKTTLAANLAVSAASKSHAPVGIFSLEQSANALASRMMAARARVNLRKIKPGCPADMFQRLGAAAGQLAPQPIWFDDRGGLTPTQIRARARAMKAKHGCRLFIIDYLQLTAQDDPRANRYTHVTNASMSFKAMAKELDAPVILLSQLSRDCDKENRRPRLSDLRESGAIEQDADVVLLLSARVEMDDLPESIREMTPDILESLAIVDVAKQREGPTPALVMRFNKECTVYEELAPA